MRLILTPTLLAAALALCGCAELATSTKNVDLRNTSIAIDAKQRVVTSSVVVTEERDSENKLKSRQTRPIICAEPSPDALSVIGASTGLSANRGDEDAVKLATALSESAASIGLRTQSIQLLRDAMYRLCEGYAAGAMTEPEFAAMQRRYQSTMLGVLAIEQLTGPVVAAQVLLTSAAESRAGAGADDAAVDAAKTASEAAEKKVIAAQSNVDTQKARVETLTNERKKLNDDLLAEKEKEKPDDATVKQLGENLKAKNEDLQGARIDLKEARDELKLAQAIALDAKQELNSARSAVAAAAKAGGELGAVARWNAKSSQHLTKGVVAIVEEVNESFDRDACLNVVTEYIRNADAISKAKSAGKPLNTAVLDAALKACAEILEREKAVSSVLGRRTPKTRR